MNDYERVAAVIRYLDAHHNEQPNLATLAEQAGLSEFHFHRLFSAWASITPKDFLQCLTLSHAKHLLQEGKSVLEAALDSGLSGPGRLHDLCVSLEAASPGELKSGGEGWTICAGEGESPFGPCFIAQSPRGICQLSFIEPNTSAEEYAALQARWPRAKILRDDSAARMLIAQIFLRDPLEKAKHRPPLKAYVQGSAFQLQVWRALLKIQPGTLLSYGHLAENLGKPSAARAVGRAVAHNPLAYLIPCHRVIRETGVMGEYRWNPLRKRAIVAWESARHFEIRG